MPPRKSDVSKAGTGDEATAAKEALVRDGINIEDLNLPKSIVTRLAKGVLPPNTQIQGNAMLAMTKSATVFVNYLATHSNEHASASNRKTITPQDVFNALEDLEFPDFRPRLEAELAKFNEVQTDKRNAYRNKVAENKAAAQTGQGEDGDVEDGEGQLDRDGQPATKKARIEPGDSSGMDTSEMPEGYNMGDSRVEDDGEEDERHGDEDEDEDDEEEPEERLEVEEPLEEPDHKEAEDEALDNGDDSD